VKIIQILIFIAIVIAIYGTPFLCALVYPAIATYTNRFIPLFIRKTITVVSFILPIITSINFYFNGYLTHSFMSDMVVFILHLLACTIAVSYSILYYKARELMIILIIALLYYADYMIALGILGMGFRNQ